MQTVRKMACKKKVFGSGIEQIGIMLKISPPSDPSFRNVNWEDIDLGIPEMTIMESLFRQTDRLGNVLDIGTCCFGNMQKNDLLVGFLRTDL